MELQWPAETSDIYNNQGFTRYRIYPLGLVAIYGNLWCNVWYLWSYTNCVLFLWGKKKRQRLCEIFCIFIPQLAVARWLGAFDVVQRRIDPVGLPPLQESSKVRRHDSITDPPWLMVLTWKILSVDPILGETPWHFWKVNPRNDGGAMSTSQTAGSSGLRSFWWSCAGHGWILLPKFDGLKLESGSPGSRKTDPLLLSRKWLSVSSEVKNGEDCCADAIAVLCLESPCMIHLASETAHDVQTFRMRIWSFKRHLPPNSYKKHSHFSGAANTAQFRAACVLAAWQAPVDIVSLGWF